MTPRFERIKNYLFDNFALDLRALALMRIAMASVVIIDLCIRASSLTAFFTEEGVLPLSILYKSNWNPSFFSVYAIGTSRNIVSLIFILNIVAALLLMIGYRTRLMTVICWIFIVSLHNRNPLILQGGDELLRLILFWCIFIPWGRRYSVDAVKAAGENTPAVKWFDVPAAGYILLLFSVYYFSAVLKDSPEWRSEGSALYYALQLDQMTWPAGKFLLNYPGLLKILTHCVYYIELLAPFLLFIPWKTMRFRMLFVMIIILFHAGISVTLYVGLFYLIGIASLIGLLSSNFMDSTERRFIKIKTKLSVILQRLASVLPGRQATIKLYDKPSELARFQINLLYRGALVFTICFNLLWCFGNTNNAALRVNEKFLWFAYFFRFDQNWGMFAPSVYKNDGWYIYEASLERDTTQKIDLNRNGLALSYKKPENIIALYPSDRWRKYGEIYQAQTDMVKKELCRYLKNNWNIKNPSKRISSLKIVYMLELSQPSGKIPRPERTVQCDCEKF